MSEGTIAIVVAVVSLLSQGLNVFLHLRVRNAILEFDKQARKDLDERLKEYVLEDLCAERHRVHRGRA